jgi:hypothetical protein
MKILWWTILTDKGLQRIKDEVRSEYRKFTNKQVADLMYQNAQLMGIIKRTKG